MTGAKLPRIPDVALQALYWVAENIRSLWKRAVAGFWGWAAGLLLALAGSALIESTKWLDGFEDLTVREVARRRAENNEGKIDRTELRVRLIELSAEMRVQYLEQHGAPKQAVARLRGVAPIDRARMASVLEVLAERLPASAPQVPIVAIDIDLAPLEEGGTSVEDRQRMLGAVNTLREKAHVIALVLPRAPKSAGDRAREDRNAFMREAGCSRLREEPAANPPPPHGLFFASPRIFQDAGSYPVRFLMARKDAAAADAGKQGVLAGLLPPYFPSLGTLIQLQHARQGSSKGAKGQDDPNALATLTALCEQAHAPAAGGELLEDLMDDRSAAVIGAYKEERYSWRLLDDPRLAGTLVASIDALNKDVGDHHFADPVLLLSADGGGGYDKFGTAGASSEPVSGATLHALQALSIASKPPGWKEKLASLLVDVAAAVAFGLLWRIAQLGLKPLRAAMPVIGGWCMAFVPLLIAYGLASLTFKFAAVGMEIDLWLNPIYVLAGLALDAYLHAWDESERGSAAKRKFRQRRFGLIAAREALRRGFGRRLVYVPAPGTAQTPPPDLQAQPLAGHLRSSELGPAAQADALISAVARVTVLVLGSIEIANKLWK